MARVVIFGAGDIARLARFYFSRDSEHEVVAFAVDAEYRKGDEFDGLPLIDAAETTRRYPPADYKMFVALSYAKMNRARAAKYQWAKDAGFDLVSYVSTRCSYLSDHRPGDNCFILEDNTIQPFVTIGSNVTMWSGNHIGHDSVIEDHCFITSHTVVSGHVRVGAYTFIGVNATLRNSITVGARTLIGAGAVIMADTKPNSVHVPAKSQELSKSSDDVEL